MYGLINIAIQDLVTSRYGPATWQAVLARASMQEMRFEQMTPYDDPVTFDLVAAASAELGLAPNEILRAFGQYWTLFTVEHGYGDLLDQAGSSFEEVLGKLNRLHVQVQRAYPKLRPPHFQCRTLPDGSGLDLVYRSEREGLEALVEGLILGLGSRFGLNVTVELTQPRDPDGKCVFRITYPDRETQVQSELLEVGTDVGNYRITEQLQHAPAGVAAYLATHIVFERRVELHIWADCQAAKDGRFSAQMRRTSRFRHPAIPMVLETGSFEGHPFVVLEHIKGWSLAPRSNQPKQPVGIRTSIRIAQEVALVLHASHNAGLLHNRLCLADLTLGADGEVHVGGFIHALALHAPPDEKNRPSYLPPNSSPQRIRPDLRALGRVLTQVHLGQQTPVDSVRSVKLLEERLPPLVLRFVLRCFSEDPATSFDSLLQAAQALSEILTEADQFAHTAVEPKSGEHLILSMAISEPNAGGLRRYTIGPRLGRGTYGDVYRATDQSLGRQVALKLLKRRWLNTDSTVGRFKREAAILAKLRHPNIVKIYNFGQHEDSYFIAMEYLSGRSLATILKSEEAIDLERALHWCAAILEALAFVHDRRVVHHDIKPSNVFECDDGRIVLMDFGMAVSEDLQRFTLAGDMIGTPAYMAPEVLHGNRGDGTVDAYAVGVIVYQALTRQLPFRARSIPELILKISSEAPTPMARFRADLPESVVRLVAGLLHKDPSERTSVLDAKKQLQAIRASLFPSP